jgi:hypothetical protein
MVTPCNRTVAMLRDSIRKDCYSYSTSFLLGSLEGRLKGRSSWAIRSKVGYWRVGEERHPGLRDCNCFEAVVHFIFHSSTSVYNL